MTVAARRIDPDVWTKERFLAWDEVRPGDGRYEFDGFQLVAMPLATLAHNDIGRNIRDVLRVRLPANMGCRPYGPQQPIETVGGAICEPDGFIACSARHARSVAISAPVVVFEVLSPGPQEEKVDEYESVPSILRYVIVESEVRGVHVFWREPGERQWHREPLDSVGPVQVPEFGVVLSFDEIYADVEFD